MRGGSSKARPSAPPSVRASLSASRLPDDRRSLRFLATDMVDSVSMSCAILVRPSMPSSSCSTRRLTSLETDRQSLVMLEQALRANAKLVQNQLARVRERRDDRLQPLDIWQLSQHL